MTRLASVVILGLAFCAGVAPAQVQMPPRSSSADSAQVVRLEHILTDAWLKNDTATVFSMFADDYEYWSFTGVRRNKDDLRRMFQKPSTDRESATRFEDPQVRVYGDAAIFTSHIIDTGKHGDGQPFTVTTAVTIVWARRGDNWQIVADHETLLPDK